MLQLIETLQPKSCKGEHLHNNVVPWLIAAFALLCISLLFVHEADARQRCWPLQDVLSAHEKQGDEILLTFSSWIREGAYTIIFHDPSDGVVTEIAVHTNGTACIYDVGTASGSSRSNWKAL